MIDNLMTYLWILSFVSAIVIMLIGILRWMAEPQKRKSRLTIISICAFVVFVIMILSANWNVIVSGLGKSSEANDAATMSLINISKIISKILLILLIVAFSIMIAMVAVLFVAYGGWAIVHTILASRRNNVGQLKRDLEDEAEKLTTLLRTPVFIIIITGGILALFVILPLVMGGETESLAKCWKSGVEEIAYFCTNQKDLGFGRALSLYSLIFISILGIGYGVGNILFEIIKERFEKKRFF